MNDTCRKYELKTTDECEFFNGIIERIERLKIETVREEFIVMLEDELKRNNNYEEYDEGKEYGFPPFDLSIDSKNRKKYPLYDLNLEMNIKVNEYIDHLNYLDFTLNDVETLTNRGSAKAYLRREFQTLLNERNIYQPEEGGNIPALRSYIRRFKEFKSRFDNTKKGGARKRSKSKKRSKSHKRTKSRSKK